jgi:hypothetical protein
MKPAPSCQTAVIVCEDLPEAYVRQLYGDRIGRDTEVFSRPDALRKSAAGSRGQKRLRSQVEPEAADAGLRRFLGVDASRAKSEAASPPASPLPLTQSNGKNVPFSAESISFEVLLAEVERAHDRIYAPQLGIAGSFGRRGGSCPR